MRNTNGKEVTTKPWQLAEWRAIRKSKIGKACAQCGSSKPPLVLQHLPSDRSRTPEEYKEYLSCKDTLTFCKKCAFLWDVKGMNLCPRCRVRYKKLRFPYCYSCSKESGLVHPSVMERLGVTKEQEAEMDKEFDSMHSEGI